MPSIIYHHIPDGRVPSSFAAHVCFSLDAAASAIIVVVTAVHASSSIEKQADKI